MSRILSACCCRALSNIEIPSVVPNLIDLLGTLLARAGGGTGGGGGAGGAVAVAWMREILFAVSVLSVCGLDVDIGYLQDDFIPSKATAEVKEKFVKAVIQCVLMFIFYAPGYS